MKLPFATSVVSGALGTAVSTAFGTASILAVVAGGAYILDCRLGGGTADRCWLTGLPLMGIGGAAGGSFRMGYNTYNPTLRTNAALGANGDPAAYGSAGASPPEPPEPPTPPTATRRRTSTSRR